MSDAETAVSLRAAIRAARALSAHTLVILDDDPTGSQLVHDVPVITSWDDDDLDWAFSQPGSAFFVLTNTRSLGGASAARLVSELADAVDDAASRHRRVVDFVLRGDSTLRGHFPLESDVLAERAQERGEPYDAIILVPAFPEAGRVTRDNVHLVTSGDDLVPVGLTDYANDATFGFTSSDLREYVEEKTGGTTRAEDVVSIGLDDIRVGGPDDVAGILRGCHDRRPVVVNAMTAADLDVVALGIWTAQRSGCRALIRCGPSFVGSLLGLDARPPLSRDEIVPSSGPSGHGLIVVGSHVALTGEQLDALRARRGDSLTEVVLDVPRLVAGGAPSTRARDAPAWEAEVARCASSVAASIGHADVLLVTSRTRVDGSDADGSLRIAREVSRAIVEVVARVVASVVAIGWVVAKGGITSSDVATKALGIRRAEILGQMFPGQVSAWSCRTSERGGPDGVPYIVFAGNVGGPSSLADVVDTLAGPARAG